MTNMTSKLCFIIAILLFTIMPINSFANINENNSTPDDANRPVLYSAYPKSADTSVWFDEKALKHTIADSFTADKYFIRAVFKDTDGTLIFNGLENLKSSTIRPSNGTANLLDIDFINKIIDMEDSAREQILNKYIFVKNLDQVTLYIPVKELRSQTTYEVSLASQAVAYDDDIGENMGNEAILWSFTTTTTPFVENISTGSIPENYDSDIPLTIYGDFFYTDTVSVYFNDLKATLGAKTRNMLEVYLPSGGHRLKTGIYDITVQNGVNHKRTLHGILGVVKAGEALSGDGYVLRNISKGEIRSDTKVSKDILMLSSGYNNDAYLKIDLDELMGADVLLRGISFDGDSRNKIGIMETKSKWADITLYELALAQGQTRAQVNLKLGRTEPEVAKNLRNRLKNKVVRSEFLQVTGENLRFKNVFLSIPLQKGLSKNLTVYRYDEETRSFYEESATINLVDQRAELLTSNKGIFVVIEK